MKKNKKGFTLAELLIVVAIIAVLVAISIPIFTSQLEESRKAVDLANARNIYAAFSVAANDGTIEFTSEGAWVAVTIYKTASSGNTQFRASSTGVTINSVSGGTGTSNTQRVRDIVASTGLIKMGTWSSNSGNSESSSDKSLFLKNKNTWDWCRIYVKGDGTSGAIFGTGTVQNSESTPDPTVSNVTYIMGQ